MNERSIIFMGTPEFAVPTLNKLHEEFGVKAVVTVPDKPQGRGRQLKPSPIKSKAEELNIPVMQPESLKDEGFIKELRSHKPDIICVVAFKILPESVYSLAEISTFNIHGSLLPKYRGAAPINWAIINGEKKTGVTSFLLKKKVDTGDILLNREIDIPSNATAGELHDLLMPESAKLASDTVELLLSGKAKPLPQSNEEATPAPKIFREDCKINFNMPAEEVRDFIHGMSPVPGAWTNFQENKTLKILRVNVDNRRVDSGSYEIRDEGFFAGCREGSVRVLELQLQGKKAVKIEDFLRGWRGNNEGNFT